MTDLSRRRSRSTRPLFQEYLRGGRARASGQSSDARIAAGIQAKLDQAEAADAPPEEGNDFLFDGLDVALTDALMAAMSLFLLALERGERSLVDQALERLRTSLAICSEMNMLPQWWAHRVAIHLLSDLWSSTFHERVPLQPAGGVAADCQSPAARLNLRVGDERPWVHRFLIGAAPSNWTPPKRRRTRLFPDDQRELCLATALAACRRWPDGSIFCPERRGVEPFADVIVDLHERGPCVRCLKPTRIA